jgi:hypothetical protein
VKWSCESNWRVQCKCGTSLPRNMMLFTNPLVKLSLMRNFALIFMDANFGIGSFCEGLRRIWDLPYDTHNNLLPVLSNSIPVMDAICCWSVNFINNCLAIVIHTLYDLLLVAAIFSLGHCRRLAVMRSSVVRNMEFLYLICRVSMWTSLNTGFLL